MKWLRRLAAGVAVGLVLAYGVVLAWIYTNQRALQYDPAGPLLDLAATRLTRAELVRIPSGDGATLAGWFEPPQPGRPLIVYYRGNAGSFSREHERYEAMEADGYGFVAFDYRGFGGSPGTISQANILADGLAAFDWAAQKGFPLVIWGRSLGSGPATYVASRRRADALFLETPFDSAVAVAHDRYWYLPVDLLMDDKFPVDQWLSTVDAPVFVAHGTADTTIGVAHGQRVFDLARNKGGLWLAPGADHDQLWAAGEWDKAKGFFAASERAAGR